MAWDFASQKADTETVCAELAGYPELAPGAAIQLGLQLVAGEAPDGPGFVAALRAAVYVLEIDRPDGWGFWEPEET